MGFIDGPMTNKREATKKKYYIIVERKMRIRTCM